MKKWHFLLWVLIIIATLLGLFGQALAYYVDENMANNVPPVYYLTIITVISIILYLAAPLLVYLLVKVKKIDKQFNDVYILGVAMIGLIVSLWSVFVCLMWWG